MLASDLLVQVRDVDLVRQGVILPRDLRLKATVRWNDVGEWELTLDRAHPMVEHLSAPGSGILIDARGERVLSGPTVKPGRLTNKDNPDGTFTFTGLTDNVLLRDALAFPQPSNPDPSTQTVTNDVRSGVAETVMRAFVNANIGPGAPSARRGILAQQLTLATNELRGPNVVKSPRFQNLLELEQELALFAGLGFQVIQRDDALVFEVLTLTDRSGLVVLNIDAGTLTSEAAEVSPPDLTRAIIAGQGEGTDRVILQRTNTDAEDAEDTWGRVIEEWIDARGTSETDELEQNADGRIIEAGFTSTAIKVVPSDDQTMLYLTDWREGETIGVVVNGAKRTAIVTAAAIIAGPDRVAVGMSIGDTSGMTEKGSTVAKVQDTARKVAKLEQAVGEIAAAITWGTLPGVPAALTTDGGADKVVFWDDSANALGQAALAAPLAMTGTSFGVAAATDTAAGVSELATPAEAVTGTDATRTVTPAALAAALAALVPPGNIDMTAARTAPAGWLLCDGSAVSRTTYAALFAALVTSLGTATVTIASPGVFTKSSHGLSVGDKVYLTTTGALPTGLAANTLYYVVSVPTSSTFTLSATAGGSAINTSGSQSGVHTLFLCPWGLGNGSTTFNVPNLKGVTPVGRDTAQAEFAGQGQAGGAKTHTLDATQLPQHQHQVNLENAVNAVQESSSSANAGWSFNVGGTSGGLRRFIADNLINQASAGGAHNNLQPYVALNFIIKI